MKGARDSIVRSAYRVAYRMLRVWWRVASTEKRSVKCVLSRGGEVLLVRHTYGPTERWELPGGGLRRGEEPAEAARREIREELGVDLAGWRFLGELSDSIDGKRDLLWCFACELGDGQVAIDAAEIAEARWFPRGELPPERHGYVARVLAL